MEDTRNKYIAVAYELYVTEDGDKELVEKAPAERPFRFISGLGTTLERFENELKGLNKGDRFEFTIPVGEAYGEYDEENTRELPKSLFEIDGKFDSERIAEGNIVPMMNADGQRFNGTVTEVKKETVVMDFNHPLAGKDLTFVGEVTESRHERRAPEHAEQDKRRRRMRRLRRRMRRLRMRRRRGRRRPQGPRMRTLPLIGHPSGCPAGKRGRAPSFSYLYRIT